MSAGTSTSLSYEVDAQTIGTCQGATSVFKNQDWDAAGRAVNADYGEDNPMNCVYEDPTNEHGRVFIGNIVNARGNNYPCTESLQQSLHALQHRNIKHIVCCNEHDEHLYHEATGAEITYFRYPNADQNGKLWQCFPINLWKNFLETEQVGETPALGQPAFSGAVHPKAGEMLKFFTPVFDFCDAAISRNEGVLIHCIAGAHRAGTTGTALLMYKHGWDRKTAFDFVKSKREQVDVYGAFRVLLRGLERDMVGEVNDLDGEI